MRSFLGRAAFARGTATELTLCCCVYAATAAQFGPVTNIDFCQEYPYNFAVTASTRVSMGQHAITYSLTGLTVLDMPKALQPVEGSSNSNTQQARYPRLVA
jgi:hypothetical protein